MTRAPDESASASGDPREPVPRAFIRRAIAAAGVAIFAFILLLVLGRAIDVVLVTFAGVLLGVFLLALRDALARKTPLSERVSLAIVIVALLGIAAGGGALIGPRIADQIDDLTDRMPQLWAQGRDFLLQYGWGRQLLDLIDANDAIDEMTIVSVAGIGLQLFAFIVVFFVVGFFIAIHPKLYMDGLVNFFPLNARERAQSIVEEMGDTLRWFLVARAIAMVLVGISTAILLHLLDIPLALLLGLIAGMFTFVPYLGPIAAGVPIFLISLLEGPRDAAFAVGLYTGIQLIEGYIFDPLIMQRVVKVPPAVTVVSQILGGVVLGILGIILAMPLVAVFQVLLRRAYRENLLGEPVERNEEHDTTHTRSFEHPAPAT